MHCIPNNVSNDTVLLSDAGDGYQSNPSCYCSLYEIALAKDCGHKQQPPLGMMRSFVNSTVIFFLMGPLRDLFLLIQLTMTLRYCIIFHPLGTNLL